ncbi:MAG: hypothetical protein U5K43_13015 [Halofilum sp. (in: g-proteobacteria)]|nr:hypothetical protein [Halofilum sp. (in: g-proteobacteria)]
MKLSLSMPDSDVIYLTEDEDEGIYFIDLSKYPGQLLNGGTLQALAISGNPSFDTRNWESRTVDVGQQLDVEWIDLDNIRQS